MHIYSLRRLLRVYGLSCINFVVPGCYSTFH